MVHLHHQNMVLLCYPSYPVRPKSQTTRAHKSSVRNKETWCLLRILIKNMKMEKQILFTLKFTSGWRDRQILPSQPTWIQKMDEIKHTKVFTGGKRIHHRAAQCDNRMARILLDIYIYIYITKLKNQKHHARGCRRQHDWSCPLSRTWTLQNGCIMRRGKHKQPSEYLEGFSRCIPCTFLDMPMQIVSHCCTLCTWQ